MTLGGIVDDVLHLLLGVIGLVGHVVIHTGEETLDFASAVGAPGRELGVALELDAPALVVGEVPVKHVHLVQCQPVDVFLDIGHREEVAHHVEQHAAVAEAGSVVDAPGRNVGDEASPGGQQLQERLHAVEEAGLVVAGDGDAGAVDLQGVALVGTAAGNAELDGRLAGPGACGHAQRQAQILLAVAGQVLRRLCGLSRWGHHEGAARDHEVPAGGVDTRGCGAGNDVVLDGGSRCCQRCDCK